MRKKLLNITLCLIAVATLCSCDKNNDNFSGDYLLNFVTYEGLNDGVEHFSYQKVDDSPIIKLSTTKPLNLKWTKGQRVIIDYTIIAEKSSTEKVISIDGIISVLYDPLRMASIENIKESPNAPIRLKSIWRTGEFINIDCTLPYTLTNRQFQLIVDQNTLDSEIVEAYLIQNIMNAESYFWRKAYASFFIGNAWNRPSCKTIRVHLYDESYPVDYYDFKKN